MSRIQTYILAPNFTLTASPESPRYPWLGNIIADPLLPTSRTLDKLSSGPPDNIVSVQEEKNTYTKSNGRSINASIWATFLQAASANLGGATTKDVSIKYSMSAGMETRYFEPTDDEVTARVERSAKARAAMDSGLFGRRPVYMITGLKIAKGFSLESSVDMSVAGDFGGSAPITPAGEVSAGAEVGGSLHRQQQMSYKTGKGVDVIFAYQVHVIAKKGWREKSKRLEADVYQSKQAFLGQEADAEIPERLESFIPTKADLELEELERKNLQSVELVGGSEDTNLCILLNIQGE